MPLMASMPLNGMGVFQDRRKTGMGETGQERVEGDSGPGGGWGLWQRLSPNHILHSGPYLVLCL